MDKESNRNREHSNLWIFVRTKPEFLRSFLNGWLETLPDNILGSGKGLSERNKKAGWNEEYLT